MELLLIRHGQTPNNVAGSLDTAFPGAGLTALGEHQARAVPAALAGVALSGIYASPLVRTQQTAEPLASTLDLDTGVVPGLEEISAGSLEMLSDPVSAEAYATCLLGWMEGDLDRRMPGGTTGHAFIERYDRAIRRIVQDSTQEQSVAVFSHGAAIRVYTAVATGLSPARARTLTIDNTGMSVLSGGPGRWHLASWHPEPLGGPALEGFAGNDVTGQST
ncbi:histidine phosphatase family protein [Arthrobacter agilis]|uniref:Histidine phosphatase family protein n=1 Tax=Arthrobacter agilis TaxID=37921 RepID=A0A2L0UBD6_9MICC|nr:histidine phosphatase family protein [Arthrobacter agilis]AUZ86537.1 histidine phosphatase family protein [Arthrobacter agilis]